jgi:hypothetical protein
MKSPKKSLHLTRGGAVALPPSRGLNPSRWVLCAMKISMLFLLLTMTACSTSLPRPAASHSVLSAEYWHTPPPIPVLESRLRVGMSGDEFAKLVGIAEPACISCMTDYYFLPNGILSTRHDSSGRLVWWALEESVSK